MRKMVYWTWLFTALALTAATGWQTARTLQDRRAPTAWIYNSDFLAPAALYQDLLVDGYSIRTFQPSASSFLFPDYVAYFGVRAVVGDNTAAVPIWILTLFVLLFASGWVAAASLTPRPTRAYLLPALLSWVAFYVTVNTFTFFETAAADLLMPVFHCGAQVASFLGLALLVGFLNSTTLIGRAAWLAGLLQLSLFAAFSDRLFGLYFVAPLAVTLLVFLLRPRHPGDGRLPVTWTRAVLVGGAIVLGCAAGLGILRLIQGHSDPLSSYWGGGSTAGLLSRALATARMIGQAAEELNFLVLMGLLWYAISGVYLVRVAAPAGGSVVLTATENGLRGAFRVRWVGEQSMDRGFTLYVLFSVAQLVVVTGVFLLSRTGELSAVQETAWKEVSRYFVGPLASAFVGLAIVSARAAASVSLFACKMGVAVPVGLAGVALGFGLSEPRDRFYSLSDLRPRWVQVLDESCAKYELRDGLTDYWTSKPAMLLSSRGTRPLPAYPSPGGRPYGLIAFSWLGNAEWYWVPPAGNDAVEFRYVIVAAEGHCSPYSLKMAEVIGELGEPRVKQPIGGHLVLLVYDRPSDVRFHRFAELNCTVLNHQFHAVGPRGPYRYPGNSLNSLTHVTTATDERVAEEGITPEGYMALGPYFRPPTAGWHKATFRLTCTGTTEANAAVSVMIYDPRTNTDRTLATRVIPPGTDGTIEVPFELTREMKRMELQFPVIYSGKGRVVLHWVEYE